MVPFALRTRTNTHFGGSFTRDYWRSPPPPPAGLRYLVCFQEEARHSGSCSSQILRGILSAHKNTHKHTQFIKLSFQKLH